MEITNGKTFMNLEIKYDNEEIQEYIEKYEYFNHPNLYFQQGLY